MKNHHIHDGKSEKGKRTKIIAESSVGASTTFIEKSESARQLLAGGRYAHGTGSC